MIETLDISEKQIKEAIRELYIEPHKNLRKWSKLTHQTCQIRMAYIGQHLASLITGVKGKGTAARGDDLSDGTDVKSCSRADQLSECNKCGEKVLIWQGECPKCGARDINVKTDSHWIFSIRSEKELDLYLNKIPRVILILFDRKSTETENIRLRAWMLNPKQWYYQKFFKNYYYKNYKVKDNPAPCNLHPGKRDFYMMEPMLVFNADINMDEEEVDIRFWNLKSPKKEKMPSVLASKDELLKLFGKDEILDKVRELEPHEKEEYVYKNDPSKIKKLQKNQVVRLFPYIPEDKRNQLKMKKKTLKSYEREYERR